MLVIVGGFGLQGCVIGQVLHASVCQETLQMELQPSYTTIDVISCCKKLHKNVTADRILDLFLDPTRTMR